MAAQHGYLQVANHQLELNMDAIHASNTHLYLFVSVLFVLSSLYISMIA